jgi:L-seryl-tRNA(Ser) seleniumtransferase
MDPRSPDAPDSVPSPSRAAIDAGSATAGFGRSHPPSVDRVVSAVVVEAAVGASHDALVALARTVVEEERGRIAAGEAPRTAEALAADVAARLGGLDRPSIPAVLNATGVIVHTNLGRAPWPDAALRAAAAAGRGYLLLELDRQSGRRGARYREAEEHIVVLTGAEDCLVVNNNAAAVALAVGLAGRGKGVAVSRGELVEIGGGVRIPEIVRRAGARLVEVGTTNRTRVADYEEPLAAGRAKLVLRVHPSNFRQSGFTEAPDPAALAELAHRHGAIVLDDLGSGALLDTAAFGLAREPTPADALSAGADLVMFSGDKLLGGPQAGLIAGRGDLVARLRRDPLARAMRPDKTTLAALAATLGLYRAGRAEAEIPVWRAIAAPVDEIRGRAEAAVLGLVMAVDSTHRRSIKAVPLEATVGGGSLPGETLPSWGIAIRIGSPDRLLSALRTGEPAVVGRIADDAVVLDLRTVPPSADDELAGAIEAAVATVAGDGAADESTPGPESPGPG